jgi:hypothetical protein
VARVRAIAKSGGDPGALYAEIGRILK